MDALAQLAIMTKAKLVFENPDTFLSFPALSPLGYTPDQLTFLPAPHDMVVFSDFSELTNALPQAGIFQPSLDNLLWNVYLNVLRNAQLAQGTLTDEQNTELEQAEAYLYTQGADGLPTPSAAVLAYNQYQQAYIRATQNYKAQQLTAAASSGPTALAQWQDTDEPALRAEVDAAESDWENKGFKGGVEQARQVEQRCTALSPSLQWKSWVSQCNPDIDFLTDANNRVFAPTVFSPYDILDNDNWPSFTMSGPEIQQLATQAPVELANAVGTVTPNSTVDTLSFEFCSVALSRPWFHPEVFAARFWRFADPSMQLSDGNVPPQGQWPAYISALVFARNIVATMHTTGGGVEKQPILVFPPIGLHATAHFVQPAPGPPQPLIFHPPGPQPMHPTAVMPAAVMMHTAPVVSVPVKPAAPAAILPIHPQVMMRLNVSAFRTQPSAAGPAAPSLSSGATAATPTTVAQPSTGAGQVSILAFVCKRLSKSPNPDPSLDWG